MPGRVGQKPISLKMRETNDAPPVTSTKASPTTAPPKVSTDMGVEAPKAKKVNITGRHKPAKAPGPVNAELADDVKKLRSAAAAGGSSSIGTSKGAPIDSVQKMTTKQLATAFEQLRSGKLTDPDLKLAVASEVAARTRWGKENPEPVAVMRDRIRAGSLRLEDVSNTASVAPEKLVQRLAEDAQFEYLDTLARTAQATRIPEPRKKIIHTDGIVSSKVGYERLPSDLKNKMAETVWRDLEPKQRDTLISTYSRLKSWGVWDEVKQVKGELNPTEPQVHVGGATFDVAGNTGGVVFEAKDAKRLTERLLQTGHFGVDKGIVGSLHQGQVSTREWTEDPGSLHLSIGPGNQFDTHLDKFSPVNRPTRGETQIDPEKGFDHHRNEVWPEYIRDAIGLPGVIVDAELRPNPDGGRPEIRGTIGLELHGPVKSERKTVDRKQLERINPVDPGEPGPPGLINGAIDQVNLKKVSIPRPAGVPADAIDPRMLAEHLAAKMLAAARAGKDPITLDLPDYANSVKVQPEMTKQLTALAREVHAQLEHAIAKLPPDERAAYDLSKVQSLKVTYGVKTQGARVRIDD